MLDQRACKTHHALTSLSCQYINLFVNGMGSLLLPCMLHPECHIRLAAVYYWMYGVAEHASLQGSCPNCGSSNSTYFGDILTVKGNREKNEVQCGECKAKLQFDSGKRQVSIAVLLTA